MGFKWSYWTCASHLLKTLLLQRCLVKTESELKKQSEERQKMAACTSFENTAFFLLARELLLYEQYHKLILPPSTSSAGEKQQTTRVHCSKSCKKCPWLSRELWTSTITRIWAHQNSKCLLVSLAPPSLCFCMCVCVCVCARRSCVTGVYMCTEAKELPQVHFRCHSFFKIQSLAGLELPEYVELTGWGPRGSACLLSSCPAFFYDLRNLFRTLFLQDTLPAESSS